MKVVFTFGRFNPPTIGHQLLVKKVKEAGGRDYMIYASQTQNNKKDPLEFSKKVEWMKKSFPECAAYISSDPSIKSIFDILVSLYGRKYTEVAMVVGSDRVDEFRKLIEQYNECWNPDKRIKILQELDYIASSEYHWIFGWAAPYGYRCLHWNKFSMPENSLGYSGNWSTPLSLWWIDPNNKANLKSAQNENSNLSIDPEIVDYYNSLEK